MKLLKNIIVFLFINFGALAIGAFLMDNGPRETWYLNLNKAPWTPPGWVFGVAWTIIMLCFSIYMALLLKVQLYTKKILILFVLQLLLNIIWNYIFFNKHLVLIGLFIIALLTFVVSLFTFGFLKQMKLKSLLILPYLIWLYIATSLNAYILLNN